MADPDPSLTALTPVPGQSAPLAVLTPSDHSAILLITTSIGLVFALISLLIRYFVRMEFRHSFAPDDVLATVAMVFAILQASTVFVACHQGFGKTIGDVSAEGLVELQKATYAGDILYIITIYLTKSSIAALFLRLSPNRSHRRISHLVLLTCTLFALTSIFLLALKCNLSHPWIYIGETCTALLARWDIIATFDILSEIALFATSIYLVKDLQLSLSKKAVVIGAFAFRLPVLIPIAFRLHYVDIDLTSSVDQTMTGVLVQVMTQVEISYAIIAATIPCLRPFMSALSTNYGAPAENVKGVGTHASPYAGLKYSLYSLSSRRSRGRGGQEQVQGTTTSNNPTDPTLAARPPGDVESATSSHAAPLPTTSTTTNSSKATSKTALKPPRFRWDLPRHEQRTTIIGRGDGHSMESHESKQMIIERNREWAVEYESTGKNGNGDFGSERELSSAGSGSVIGRPGSRGVGGVGASVGGGVGGGGGGVKTFFRGASEENIGVADGGGV